MRNTLPNLFWIALLGLLPTSPALSGSAECSAKTAEHTVAY